MATQALKIGLFGGPNGDSCDINDKTKLPPASLKSVEIWSTSGKEDGVINAIRFTFVDSENHKFTVGPWGTPLQNQKCKTIDMEGVYVTQLSGYTDDENITSLTFFTGDTKRKHGPYGKVSPTKDDLFNIPLLNGHIVAFFGQANDCLSSIGVYAAPMP